MRLFFVALLLACVQPVLADTILSRFKTPEGFATQKVEPGSFAGWLQNLPLKPVGTHTKTYRGEIARTDIETVAVVDISVGTQVCNNAQTR